MLFLAAVIAVWQLLRIPFEGSTRLSLAHARDWIDLERALHIDVEPSFLRFVHGRDWLLHAAQAFYRNLNEPVMLGFMAIARLLDPVRYPKLRTAYVLLHVPALAVLALYPLAPPHWVAGIPYADGPPLHPSALRNETAAAVSLHFGAPLLLAGGALWLRPRAPLAWLTLLYPPAVFLVILGTGRPLRARHDRGRRLRRCGRRGGAGDPRAAAARSPGRESREDRATPVSGSGSSRSSSMAASSRERR